MVYLHIFLTYTLISSAVLFYGIEINRTIYAATLPSNLDLKICIKSFVTIIIATVLSYLLTELVLIPIEMGELYPLISILVFLCVSTFIEALVRITANFSTSEFAVSWLIVLLALTESSSLAEALLIAFSSSVSFIIIIPVVSSFPKRMFDASDDSKEKMHVYLFLSIAVIMMIISVFDVTWFNCR